MSGPHEHTIVHSGSRQWAPLIPRIESAKVGSKSLANLIRPGSDFRGDRIRCDTGLQLARAILGVVKAGRGNRRLLIATQQLHSSDSEARSMATKRQRVGTSSSDSSVADKKKRWQVSVATFMQCMTN